VLYIHVWKEETLSKTVSVRMDGKISIPLADDIQAAGLTPLKLKEKIIREITRFCRSSECHGHCHGGEQLQSLFFGQVKNPGVLRLRSETTIAQAISMVGGFY